MIRILDFRRFSERKKYLLVSLASAGILILSRFIDPNSMPEICIFKVVTGVPCMFCGLTHAFYAISNAHFQEAMNFHPLAFVAYGVVIFLTIYSTFRFLFWEKIKKYRGIEEKILKYSFILFTLFWLYRIISGEIL